MRAKSLIWKLATFLYRKMCAREELLVGRERIEKCLVQMNPGKSAAQLLQDYYVRKIAYFLISSFAGIVLGILVSVKASGEMMVSTEGEILRGDYDTEAVELEVIGETAGKKQQFQIQVSPKQLEDEEVEELYAEFVQVLPGFILGENTALEQVKSSLCLYESYEGFPFWVNWTSNKPEILSAAGEVWGSGQVILQAEVSYYEWSRECEFSITVMPATLEDTNRWRQELERELFVQEAANRKEEIWILPAQFQGVDIAWSQVKQDSGPIITLLAMGVAVLIFFFTDKDLFDAAEKRKKRIRRSYTDVVHTLVLYLGAGMTIRGSFRKIADDYLQKDHRNKASPVYEEILYICRELQTGISESAAYEHFGKRCGVQEYIRLSTLLAQNLKKGNYALLERLKEEATHSNEEYLQLARKWGEEASTKLLLPMVVMLLVVMVIIMLPAFWSVGV